MTPNTSSSWHWYIAEVANNTERSTYRRLQKRVEGLESPAYEVYLPLKNHTTTRADGRQVTTQVPCYKGYLFIRCTDAKRLELAREEPNIKRYFIAPGAAQSGNRRTPYIVPDRNIEELRQMEQATQGNFDIAH